MRSPASSPSGAVCPVMVHGACTTATSPSSRTRTCPSTSREAGNIQRKPSAWFTRICRRRVHHTPTTFTKSASSANRSASASASAAFQAAAKASATAAGPAGRAATSAVGSAGDMAAPGSGRTGSAGGPVGQHQHDGGEQHRHHGQDREHGAQGRTRARVGRGRCIRTSGHARQCGTRHGARGAFVGARRRCLPARAQSTLKLRMWLPNTKRSNTVRAELGSSA